MSAVERGHVATVTVASLRALFGAVEARLHLAPAWRGAELDRLLDAEHARIVEAVAWRLEAAGWHVLLEATYAIGGERGSVDVFGFHPARRAVLVAEVKSGIPAAESTGRKLDEKGRLATLIARDRLGWTPVVVAVVLVLPESVRLRRLLAGPARALARMFPVDARAVRAWLANPTAPLAATWFLANISARSPSRVEAVRRARAGAGRTGSAGVAVGATHARSPDDDDDNPPSRVLR